MRQPAQRWLRPLIVVVGMLPLLAIVAAPTVQAVDTLTITTTYPSVEVDPGGSVSLPLNVQTPDPAKVDLSVTEAPQGWATSFHGGGFIVTSVYTTGSAASPPPSDLMLQVQVPANATPNDYKFNVHAASGTMTADLPIDLVVANDQGGSVTFTTDVPAKKGTPGSAISFDLTLHNNTATEQTFQLAVPDAPTDWTVTATPTGETGATSFKVAAGDTSSIDVEATSPETESAGDFVFTVQATAGSLVASTQLGVELAGQASLSIASAEAGGVLNTTATAGSATNYTVIITNTGSAPLTNITLSSSPPSGWKVTFTPTSLTSLAPGDQQQVVAAIQPSDQAVAGDYNVDLTATSGSTTDSITIRTTVNTSTIWGIVGIALIVLVVIGLLLVFRQFGRR